MLNFLFNNSNKLRNNVDSHPSAVAFLADNGDIIYNNSKFHSLFAINDSYKPANNINDLIPNVMEQIKEASVNYPYNDVAKYVLDTDVAYFDFNVCYDEKNKHYVVAFYDVTKRQEKELQLINSFEEHKKLNKDKNAFLIKITPDLISPLQSIFGFSQAMLEGLSGELNEKQLKYIKIIHKNSKELTDLIDKILLLSKIESDNFQYDYKNVDIINILKSVKNDFKAFFEDKHLELYINNDQLTKRQCYADEKALKLILSNFFESSLSNTDLGGVKIFLKHPTRETVEAQGYELDENYQENDFIQFTISDTGNGFSDEEFVTLFNPYTNIEIGNKKNLSRALGLTIAKHFIENLNGKIWGKSVPLDGCEFNFIIPANNSEG